MRAIIKRSPNKKGCRRILLQVIAKNPIRFFGSQMAFGAFADGFAFPHFQIRAAENEKFPIARFFAESFFALDHRDHRFRHVARFGEMFFAHDDCTDRKLRIFFFDFRFRRIVRVDNAERRLPVNRVAV